jgi:hypothetical protein
MLFLVSGPQKVSQPPTSGRFRPECGTASLIIGIAGNPGHDVGSTDVWPDVRRSKKVFEVPRWHKKWRPL